jgi:hypothetical protein
MSLGLAFWIILLIAIVFFGLLRFGVLGGVWTGANDLVQILCIILLGWQVFGPPLHR